MTFFKDIVRTYSTGRYRVLCYWNLKTWCAVALEYDIKAQGTTPRKAFAELRAIIKDMETINAAFGIKYIHRKEAAPQHVIAYNRMQRKIFRIKAFLFFVVGAVSAAFYYTRQGL